MLKNVNFNRGNTYELSELSDSGQRTVLETRQLMARIRKLLRAADNTSLGMKSIWFSTVGLRRPVLQFAEKKARLQGWSWVEYPTLQQVQVMGE